ncbi:hypothetical protein ACM55K_03495 [Flavobacterium sp. LT1R49]|uniref:hypothetical protein n=1 Tax=Flavobacterium arabinosi TaxID=3398737 RepID=UPI003A85B292
MIKIYLSFPLLFFGVQFSFSQTEKLINGTVLYEKFPIAKVEVADFNSKKTTLTNASGEFSILVEAGDELFFVSKNHDIKKIMVNQNTINNKNLIISLILKPEELKEVIITKIPSIQLSTNKGYEQGKLDQLALEKSARRLKTGVYNGSIDNGMDLMRVGGMIMGLFVKEKENVKKTVAEINFTALAKSSCDQKFYLENLKLKPDEIDLFLQFCETDPKSKLLLEHHNILSVIDFLSIKNIEFKKL